MENNNASQLIQNYRPLPPAKIRRATSLKISELTTSPPPAYGSTTYAFHSTCNDSESQKSVSASASTAAAATLMTELGEGRLDLDDDDDDDGGGASPLGDSRTRTLRRMLPASWSRSRRTGQTYDALGVGEGTEEDEDLQWMNDRSREELQELLMKAHGIIKERENELGIASTVVKKVYERNVALKSKHEAFLARIPMSPIVPSPDSSTRSRTGIHFPNSNSNSESTVASQFTTPSRTRKVSIAMADISLLADQNAELLGKLQKLEEDSTSADIAGRRELKKLEKEIAYLREALEKTQAKSEELEGKVKKAVTNEAVWRKREREREIIRSAGGRDLKERTVLDFAPPGSKYGGPSEAYSLLDKDSPGWKRTTPSPRKTMMMAGESSPNQDQILISQLLQKVKELEETNERILNQQVETANQLANVQRDAMTMTKVYEFLSDRDAVELELEPDMGSAPTATAKGEFENKESIDPPTIRFRSLKRNIENSFGPGELSESFIFPPTETRTRKSVLGLFNEQMEDDTPIAKERGNVYMRNLHRHPSESERSTTTSHLHDRSPSMPPTPLSPLHFFSPLSRSQSELPHGLTLQKELEDKFGQGSWSLSGSKLMRSNSLSNISQISVPPTPSPAPGSVLRNMTQDDILANMEGGRSIRTPRRPSSSSVRRASENSLRLAVEFPTTPSDDGKNDRDEETPTAAVPEAIQKTKAKANTSRLQNISRTLRLRKHRWTDRIQDSSSSLTNEDGSSSSSSVPKVKASILPRQLSNAVDNIMESFQGISASNINAKDVEQTDGERTSGFDDNDSQDDPISHSITPPISDLEILHTAETETFMATPTAISKRDNEERLERMERNTYKHYIFQAWLWFQFVIVILVFIFAMARKGPGAILVTGDGGGGDHHDQRSGRRRRAVVRR